MPKRLSPTVHLAKNKKAAEKIARHLADKTGKPVKIVKFPKVISKPYKYGVAVVK